MEYTVIIPNKYEDIIQPLLESINEYEPNANVIIVNDGHDRDYGYEAVRYDWRFFNYSHACNLGIEMAPVDNDIILVNDDIILVEPNTFWRMSNVGHRSQNIGIVSPLIKGCVGNPLQRWHERKLYWTQDETIKYVHGASPVCFPCVWLKREMLNKIGILDESVCPEGYYGGEDVEYCMRARDNGWRTAITSEVVVQHGSGGMETTNGRGKTWSLSFSRS
jgi:GT2 family glycosyltransferase